MPNPDAPARYGEPGGIGSPPSIETSTVPGAPLAEREGGAWQASKFYTIQSDLTPALLIHSEESYLGCFTGNDPDQPTAPTHVAWASTDGPRSFEPGEPLDVATMQECWLLVWWAGAAGWKDWDSPWVIFLQRKPKSLQLDGGGLHLEFGVEAGDVVLMPLYGYKKFAQSGGDAGTHPALATRKTKTWEWPEVLPRAPLTRIRYWAGVMREFPTYCEESFSVDRRKDRVMMRSRFRYRSIDDDWGTKHIKLAPVSPPLGQVLKGGSGVAQCSGRWYDLDLFTPYGPYLGVQDTDHYEVSFPVLQYLHETERMELPDVEVHPSVKTAHAALQTATSEWLASPTDAFVRGGVGGVNQWLQAVPLYVRALYYCDEQTRSNGLRRIGERLRGLLESPGRVEFGEEQPRPPERVRSLTELAGSSPDEGVGAFRGDFLVALWAHAHFADDWSLAREQWPVLKNWFSPRARAGWLLFNQVEDARVGQEAAVCGAYARLAYQVGDLDAYHQACYLFARELVSVRIRQDGASYFREHQPYHTMEFIDEEVFLTQLRSSPGGGWEIDGPSYPATASERRFGERWVRFGDRDVARFIRDFMVENIRRELNWLQHQPVSGLGDGRGGNPPGSGRMVALRSLLLNENPSVLATSGLPDAQDRGGDDEVARWLAVLRTAHPTRYERLIAPGSASAFRVWGQLDPEQALSVLLTSVEYRSIDRRTGRSTWSWPRLKWGAWRGPKADGWTFGRVQPVRDGEPQSVRMVSLNWNTRIVIYEKQVPVAPQ